MTWHHHEDAKTMQLIPTELNNGVRHTGGDKIVKTAQKQAVEQGIDYGVTMTGVLGAALFPELDSVGDNPDAGFSDVAKAGLVDMADNLDPIGVRKFDTEALGKLDSRKFFRNKREDEDVSNR